MDRVVRVMEDGMQDADRWIRIQRGNGGMCSLEFYDLALPRSQQMFFEIGFDAYLLDLAVAGCYSRMCADGSSCSITSIETEVKLQFRPAGWPLDSEWSVPRSDFVSAVVSLM